LLTGTGVSTLKFDPFAAFVCMALYMGLNYKASVLEVFFSALQLLNSRTQLVKCLFKQWYRFSRRW